MAARNPRGNKRMLAGMISLGRILSWRGFMASLQGYWWVSDFLNTIWEQVHSLLHSFLSESRPIYWTKGQRERLKPSHGTKDTVSWKDPKGISCGPDPTNLMLCWCGPLHMIPERGRESRRVLSYTLTGTCRGLANQRRHCHIILNHPHVYIFILELLKRGRWNIVDLYKGDSSQPLPIS